jgi:hypothetical protein
MENGVGEDHFIAGIGMYLQGGDGLGRKQSSVVMNIHLNYIITHPLLPPLPNIPTPFAFPL